MLRRMVDTGEVETTEDFDEAFRCDINAVIDHLSRGYEAVNAVGCGSSSSAAREAERQLDPRQRVVVARKRRLGPVSDGTCAVSERWGFSAGTRALRGRSQYASKRRLPVAA